MRSASSTRPLTRLKTSTSSPAVRATPSCQGANDNSASKPDCSQQPGSSSDSAPSCVVIATPAIAPVIRVPEQVRAMKMIDTHRRRQLISREYETRRRGVWGDRTHPLYLASTAKGLIQAPYRPLSVVPQVQRVRPQPFWAWQEPDLVNLAGSPRGSPRSIRWADNARQRARREHDDAEQELAMIDQIVRGVSPSKRKPGYRWQEQRDMPQASPIQLEVPTEAMTDPLDVAVLVDAPQNGDDTFGGPSDAQPAPEARAGSPTAMLDDQRQVAEQITAQPYMRAATQPSDPAQLQAGMEPLPYDSSYPDGQDSSADHPRFS